MFPENWNHPKIKTRLFPLCLFRRDKLPPTGSSGRDDNPRKATRTPVGPRSALREAFLPYRHEPVCNSPSLFCRSCSVPLCQAEEQDFSGKRSYLDITLKIKSSSGDSVSLPKHHLRKLAKIRRGIHLRSHTPSIRLFPQRFLPMRKRAGRMVAALGADCFQVTFPS